ncbi:hypothetical protein XELAEV_18016950mg [Xenopus laevis]|uniref:GIY-YIG domain-containing protein n=1 Tax=Xenopus laevis TaxID=8355 RepID=A0A974DC84_XENLA|nr:hypothetical protein XELAEV_18016950mg [Xenopus laevis]
MLPNKKEDRNWLNTVGTYKCEIQSTTTGKIYKCTTYANCRTSNVVYLATCRCGKQYVGKTTRWLKDRILEHLACINRLDASSAIAEHAIQEHGANEYFVSFQAIETVKLGKRKVTPKGLNRESDIKYFMG